MIIEPLKWSLLRENKCPKCHKDFIKGISTVVNSRSLGTPQNVLEHDCGFKIREVRYSQIVSSMVNADLDDRMIEKMEEENR